MSNMESTCSPLFGVQDPMEGHCENSDYLHSPTHCQWVSDLAVKIVHGRSRRLSSPWGRYRNMIFPMFNRGSIKAMVEEGCTNLVVRSLN